MQQGTDDMHRQCNVSSGKGTDSKVLHADTVLLAQIIAQATRITDVACACCIIRIISIHREQNHDGTH